MGKPVLAVLLSLLPAVAFAGARASAFRHESRLGANYWNAQSAVDGDPATAWLLPGDSPNRGEWIEIDVPKGEIDRIGLIPGWARSHETFTDHPRLKTVRMDVMCCVDTEPMKAIHTQQLQVEDREGMQVIDVDDVQVGDELFGGRVRLSVVDIYPGQDYPNLGVSEIVVFMKEFDASPTVDEVSGQVDGHPSSALRDDDPRTFWAAPVQGASVTISAEGFGLSSVGIRPSSDHSFARPRKVRVTANDHATEAELSDRAEMQWVSIPPVTGYTGSCWGPVEVEILDVYPGERPEVGISEIAAKATNYEGI